MQLLPGGLAARFTRHDIAD